jgi:hypothetical protein
MWLLPEDVTNLLSEVRLRIQGKEVGVIRGEVAGAGGRCGGIAEEPGGCKPAGVGIENGRGTRGCFAPRLPSATPPA